MAIPSDTEITVAAEQYLYDKNLDPELLFAQTALMRQMLDVSGIDVPAALEASRSISQPFSNKRIGHYGVMSMFSLEYGAVDGWTSSIIDGRYYEIFIDAPTAISLTYKGVPQALVAMRAAPQRSACVVQIQGIRPHHWLEQGGLGDICSARGLMPLHWTSCMLHIAEQSARLAGVSKLYVQSAAVNTWARQGGRSNLGFPEDAAQKIYDDSARKNGYLLDEKTGNWKKGLRGTSGC